MFYGRCSAIVVKTELEAFEQYFKQQHKFISQAAWQFLDDKALTNNVDKKWNTKFAASGNIHNSVQKKDNAFYRSAKNIIM